MDITLPTPLLGGLSPAQFMRRHWQKKPLLIRQAVRDGITLIERRALFALASREGVESRLIARDGSDWAMRHGPLARRALPPLTRPHWTLLVQGLDLHVPAAHALLTRFRFVPDARLDDVMLSFATDGGGVGPHVDSYDVFLLQARGRRRWRIGPVGDASLLPELPLKILANFEPEQEFLLEPGDMLYLPPGWAHDGVAEGECMTASIGFRAPLRDALGRELLQRLLDDADPDDAADRHYRDPRQAATAEPGRIPPALTDFAAGALARLMADRSALDCSLGELLSEPKPVVEFDAGAAWSQASGVRLDPRSRMVYDKAFVFINGESFRAGGRDAMLMRRLADRRLLVRREVAALSGDALHLVSGWIAAGWLQPDAG